MLRKIIPYLYYIAAILYLSALGLAGYVFAHFIFKFW